MAIHGLKEHVKTRICCDAKDASIGVAAEIAALIRRRGEEGKNCVLGLATGSTPVSVYAELVRRHQQEGLSFKNVITFNLDEYYPMQKEAPQSYWRFMHEHLFSHIDIPSAHVHIPDGELPFDKVSAYCEQYEKAIEEAGGMDLQLLGIGRTGHIGFNEPGSGRDSRTRLIALDKVTRLDAASDFFGEQDVPRRAITMGVGTILAAKRVILMAFGEGKAAIVAAAVEGPLTDSVAASFLQEHPNAEVILDDAAAARLTRRQSPWLFGAVSWDRKAINKAAIWLARRTGKAILKLTEEDYNEGGLQDLLAAHGPAYNINIEVFRSLTETITGWPGGKPVDRKRPGDIDRPSDATFPKRVLVFSPHPDDDVISMGGTLIRLADQGHEVHVAYQTSGNIAVFDADAIRYAHFAADLMRMFRLEGKALSIGDRIENAVSSKKPGQPDAREMQKIKTLIRRSEAIAAGRQAGIPTDRLHFLDMPFYETGAVRKKPISEADIKIIEDLLEELRPHQIYAAGDLSDPHGTHRVCLVAILAAIDRVKNRPWFEHSEIWLYRGAWEEWEPEQIEMAVPLSPQELLRKRLAVFKHQSQKDKAMYPGVDEREFWQRAEDRNRATASLYDKLGLAEYEAMEGFVRWLPTERATTKHHHEKLNDHARN
ncbi:MAG TPA: glucosamine-6-phosphate deaminase [Tepidisphaeraceae bacterium]|jgi:glucosamine-6-phosphate deaminase|nr:glucosamine-6-phosphate deaminase [Tepidisphaeraceae bacterium]